MNGSEVSSSSADDLNSFVAAAGLEPLPPEIAEKFDKYLALILHWNARMNLTAIRDPQEILTRHFVESIACSRHLPANIETLLDFGSGAGFPGIPIALCRPEITVTLAESQSKKAAFLREAIRRLGLNSLVFAERAESLGREFDCVTLRAVDQMERAVAAASGLVRRGGWLAIMTTTEKLPEVKAAAGSQFGWSDPTFLPPSDHRVLAISSRAA